MTISTSPYGLPCFVLKTVPRFLMMIFQDGGAVVVAAAELETITNSIESLYE